MTASKAFLIDERLAQLPGPAKVNALLAGEGVMKQEIAMAAGIHPPHVTTGLKARDAEGSRDYPELRRWVERRFKLREGEVDDLLGYAPTTETAGAAR